MNYTNYIKKVLFGLVPFFALMSLLDITIFLYRGYIIPSYFCSDLAWLGFLHLFALYSNLFVLYLDNILFNKGN